MIEGEEDPQTDVYTDDEYRTRVADHESDQEGGRVEKPLPQSLQAMLGFLYLL